MPDQLTIDGVAPPIVATVAPAPTPTLPATPEQLLALRAQWEAEWRARSTPPAPVPTPSPEPVPGAILDPTRALKAAEERIRALEAETSKRSVEVAQARREAALAAERARLLSAVKHSFWPEAVARELGSALSYDEKTSACYVADATGGAAYVFGADGRPRQKTADDLAAEWIAANPDKVRAQPQGGIGAAPAGSPGSAMTHASARTPQEQTAAAFTEAVWRDMIARGQFRDTPEERKRFDGLVSRIPAYQPREIPNARPA